MELWKCHCLFTYFASSLNVISPMEQKKALIMSAFIHKLLQSLPASSFVMTATMKATIATTTNIQITAIPLSVACRIQVGRTYSELFLPAKKTSEITKYVWINFYRRKNSRIISMNILILLAAQAWSQIKLANWLVDSHNEFYMQYKTNFVVVGNWNNCHDTKFEVEFSWEF